MQDGYLTTAQAAAILGVSARRVLAMIQAKKLRAEFVGGRVWIIRPDAIDAVRDRKPGRPWHKERR